MPARRIVPPSPERHAAVLAEAVRRIAAAVPGEVNLDALRQALETEMAKGPCPLVKLMKVGRRRALDRIGRKVRKHATCPAIANGTPPRPARCCPTKCETTMMATGTVKSADQIKVQ